MIFELDETNAGDWDRFQLRNLGLAVQRQMAARYRGNAERFRTGAVKELERALGIRADGWPEAARTALQDFAAALSLVEDMDRWSDAEKQSLVRIIRAKAGADEAGYLKLMQKHGRLRRAMIDLGSAI